jgi:hypothetical protein
MNIYITLDYELFFGVKSGSVESCIIKPTNELLKIVAPYNIKLVVFVDVGYLIKLDEYRKQYKSIESNYKKITSQIKQLSKNGHGIELHIHPHWENTIYDGEKWVFNTSQYKLKDFNKDEAYRIVKKYTSFLEHISEKKVVAYRAGGWSAQPFSHIKEALKDCHIFIDSTTYPKGFHQSKHQEYDFRNIPQYKTKYNFENDLTIEDPKGSFTEYPISSYKVSPIFFWLFAYEKLKKSKKHLAFGDGSAISKPKKEILRLMTSFSNSVISIDGYKSSYIHKAFKKYVKNTDSKSHFIIIGHPKAFTPYSLSKTKSFIDKTCKEHTYKIFEKK